MGNSKSTYNNLQSSHLLEILSTKDGLILKIDDKRGITINRDAGGAEVTIQLSWDEGLAHTGNIKECTDKFLNIVWVTTPYTQYSKFSELRMRPTEGFENGEMHKYKGKYLRYTTDHMTAEEIIEFQYTLLI
jgi:hypothetical protein